MFPSPLPSLYTQLFFFFLFFFFTFNFFCCGQENTVNLEKQLKLVPRAVSTEKKTCIVNE